MSNQKQNCLQYVAWRNNLRQVVMIRLSAKLKWLNEETDVSKKLMVHSILETVDKCITDYGHRYNSQELADTVLDILNG